MSDIVERLRDDTLPFGVREGLAAAAADEIERLRLQVKMLPLPEYRDDPRLQEIIEDQRAEIERLRQELADVTSKPFAYCTEPRSEILARQQAEIERLRALLRQWRQAAEIAQDLTFAPVAKATDEALGE